MTAQKLQESRKWQILSRSSLCVKSGMYVGFAVTCRETYEFSIHTLEAVNMHNIRSHANI
jgi:hypothetical protein